MKNKTTWMLVFLLHFTACVSGEKAPKDLILQWSPDLSNSEAPLPFLAKYHRDQKFIYYLASAPYKKINDETSKMLKKVIQEYPAEVFLIEGVESAKEILTREVKDDSPDTDKNKMLNNDNYFFALELTKQKNLTLKGLEPSLRDVVAALKKEKYNTQDIINYYFLKHLGKLKNDRKLDVNRVADTYKNVTLEIHRKTSSPDVLQYSQFLIWYKNKNKENFDIFNIDTEKWAPYKRGQYFTQQLSSAMNTLRDQHMISVIEEELSAHQCILVLVDGNHWMTQRLALEALYGYPSFEYKQN